MSRFSHTPKHSWLQRAGCGLGISGLVAAQLALTAGTAHALEQTIVSLHDGVLRVQSPPGQANSISVSEVAGNMVRVRDQLGTGLELGSSCHIVLTPGGVEIGCPRGDIDRFSISTGDGADQVVTRTTLPGVTSTGDGDDVVVDNVSPAVTILLGAGNDGVKPGSGPNVVSGGAGRDVVSYKDEAAPVEVRLDDAANDGIAPRDDNIHSDVEDIIGGQGADVLVGGDFGNTIDGRGGNDFEFGLGGNDVFAGEAGTDGADVMFGGIGTDTVTYAARTGPVAVRLDELAHDGFPGENDNVHDDIENIVGTNQGDVLTGSFASNVISGLAGNDLIDGALGADTLSGGVGTDTVTYAERIANVAVRLDNLANDGQAGELDNARSDFENITTGSGNDSLTGTTAANVLSGGPGADVISGLEGNDLIDGGFGADTMYGGPGADTVTYAGRIANVVVRLDNFANDGQSGEHDFARQFENVIGGSGNDGIVGNSGNNSLHGMNGNDRLFGANGNDVLVGGNGTDFGDGGNGTDNCQTETRTRCP